MKKLALLVAALAFLGTTVSMATGKATNDNRTAKHMKKKHKKDKAEENKETTTTPPAKTQPVTPPVTETPAQ